MTKKFILGILASLLFCTCGYFENDGIKSRKRIVENIYIEQYNGSEDVNLVFDQANKISADVVGGCSMIYYDSVKNTIYVESPITKSLSSYYRIVLKNPSADNISLALKKHMIEKSSFEKAITKESAVKVKF